MTNINTTRVTFVRWLKFNLVGAIGIVLQLALLAIFSKLLHMHYLLATAAAVELTVLHNFIWHERYTWKDRVPQHSPNLLARLGRFHVANGAVSIVGNLALMKLFTGELHMPVLVANINAITICSLVNFCLANRWVFAIDPRGTTTPLKPTRVPTDDVGGGPGLNEAPSL